MTSSLQYPREISPVSEVLWCGWRSTTAQLQHNGWQLSMREDVREGWCQLTIHHPVCRVWGVSAPLRYDYFNRGEYGRHQLVFQIVQITANLLVHAAMDVNRFSPIDAMPQWAPTIDSYKHIDDFNLFAPIQKPSTEIIIDPARIGEILAKINEAQLPEQAAIRERARRRDAFEAIERGQVHAQIITLSERMAA